MSLYVKIIFISCISLLVSQELTKRNYNITIFHSDKEKGNSIAEEIGKTISKPHHADNPISINLKVPQKTNSQINNANKIVIISLMITICLLCIYLEYKKAIDNKYIFDTEINEIVY